MTPLSLNVQVLLVFPIKIRENTKKKKNKNPKKSVQTPQISFNLINEQLTLTLLNDEFPLNPKFELPWFLKIMLSNQSLKD